ncbi:MAG: ABC transporter ATP-binding protein [Rhodospirillaceae bacterium]|jgi:peptide/nickel transport system ATP-binding protein|nr:ABC transporter ATP-binding protein [Rhodospirillaceae bacterium]MBT5194231.1 ABC transporter ATP-binding protein [Rhodospirillaceae bacterium]MBT5897649.1 ABC transporter ATP-binding protein [Rhodospirillaceae bacterium]MBT6431097.1 ABC transporter ATP-binding protein [Rhodospirillaceae bacterium]
MSNVLRVRDLVVEFQAAEGLIRAVDGVSFTVPQGKTVALVGESGSGKSVVSQTIMRILPNTATISGGEVLFLDPEKPGSFVDLTRLQSDSKEMRAVRGGRISIIFQEPMTSLSPLHTIGNQISEALLLHGDVAKKTAWEMTVEMLRMVGFPDPDQSVFKYPFELSGGLRQRAMIAMALVCRPALLIADEPTTALDVTIQAQILKLIADLQSELNMAVLMITHDLGVVANVADEVVVMYHGKVMERGPVASIYKQPEHPYLKALMQAVPRFGMKSGERLVPLREISADAGHLLKQKEPWPEAARAAGPLLDVSHLCKGFETRRRSLFAGQSSGKVMAVDDISFHVNPGECVGLVGESGCGKTTTSKMIMRALAPDSGELSFNDHGRIVDVLALKDEELFGFRRKVQFIFQDPFSSLNPRMTVFDIISEPLNIHEIGDREERAARVQELMTLVGLDIRYLRRYPHSFSGGQRQRIGIARALALQPDLLICDEPVSALDVSVQAQVLNLLKDLQEELGLTYLFISHNLAVVDYVADRIAVMCAGRIVETAPRETLFRNPMHPYTQALLAAVPKADPGAKLDLTALMEGKASVPSAWPAPFTLDDGGVADMIDAGGGHFVRAKAGTQLPREM